MVYRGAWGEDGRVAYVDGPTGPRPLLTPCDAPAVEWGTEALASLRLARAILRDASDDPDTVEQLDVSFSRLLASLPSHGFALSREEVLQWVTAEGARRSEEQQPRAPARS